MMKKKINLGLIGFPLAHSLSKQLHEQALRWIGLNGIYNLWNIPPTQAGKKMILSKVAAIKAGEVHGLNVTIPYKETIIPYLDSVTPRADSIGAVNTVYWDGEKNQVMGDNTDAQAFWIDLRPSLISAGDLPHHALVLGAGGAARAVTYQLLKSNWTVNLAARRISQAKDISQHFEAEFDSLEVIHLGKYFQKDLDRYGLIINATPVGTYPAIQESPWPAEWEFPSKAVVYDLVYNPRDTCFRKQARKAGLPSKDGLGMLIEQAALAFELWTGRTAPRKEMRKAVVGIHDNQTKKSEG